MNCNRHRLVDLPRRIVQVGVSLTLIATALARPIPLADEWSFFNPEGISTIAAQSAGGFELTIADIRGTIVPDPANAGAFLGGNAVRPRVYQVFEDLKMTGVGDAVQISFDLELLTQISESNRGDLHISLFDTNTNSEMFSLVHIGPNPNRETVGDFIKFRIDPVVSPGGTFDANDLASLAVGGNSRAGQAHHPGEPLAETGIVHTFTMRVERISDTGLSYRFTWENEGNSSTHSFEVYNETTGVIDGESNPGASDVWANGKVESLNGFGVMLHDDDPFDQDDNDATFDEGTIRFSNLVVDYSSNEHPSFSITEVIKGEDGNLVRWEAVSGATYSLWTSLDLINWIEVKDSILATSEVAGFNDTISATAGTRYYQVRTGPKNQ